MPLFFDLDDTLVDNSGPTRQAALAVYSAFNSIIDSDPEQFVQRWNYLHSERFNRYLRKELTFEEMRLDRVRYVFGPQIAQSTIKEASSLFAEVYSNSWKSFSDVRPCLERLAGEKRGIITNGMQQQQLEKLTATGIIDYFTVIVCSSEYDFFKPDKRIFQAACAKMGCRLEDSLYIGDNLEIDALASAKAGMRGIWLNRTGQEKTEDVEMIKSLDELTYSTALKSMDS
ncbi:MAG TPA: HAD family hydrolase [Candidatus Nanoarchaeia archaeon]|nr:HAD family hydrolase [Candidatus Nanoarchaeia archaeon]